ncbi:hypothetical protein C1I60_14300 [Paenibacillus terrae]|uniref:Uncharacterized protein n=1 Tax=Paenibacillus terrae TaxID=159743 RepID=A0A4U2PXR4_9BACL|nr:hypothetical protein [Paenibacillus terrae]TKH43460.1 hypothetical protein C1I60_14300 [Paenibacillus terrae]
MRSFKDQVEKDVKSVFLNVKEFADWHEISFMSPPKNGLPAAPEPPVRMLVIVDDDELRDRKSSASNPTDGVYDADLLFYAQRADFLLHFGRLPVMQSKIRFDERTYTVTDIQDDENMVTVTLGRKGS